MSIISQIHKLIDSPLGAVLGGGVYGLWAFGVNAYAGAENAWLIGLSHWALSTFLTFSGVRIMRLCYHWAKPFSSLLVVRFVAACSGSLFFTYLVLVVLHILLGTPEILLTLALGFLPTIGFAITYSLLLVREERHSLLTSPAI